MGKKRGLRKPSLRKETIRTLEVRALAPGELGEVAGGGLVLKVNKAQPTWVCPTMSD